MQKIIRSNLSTTPLAGSAAFTGGAITVPTGFSRVAVAGFADETGAIHIDQSRNGTDWLASADTVLTADELTIVEAALVCPFVRVRVVNGATPQTAFDLNVAFYWV